MALPREQGVPSNGKAREGRKGPPLRNGCECLSTSSMPGRRRAPRQHPVERLLNVGKGPERLAGDAVLLAVIEQPALGKHQAGFLDREAIRQPVADEDDGAPAATQPPHYGCL